MATFISKEEILAGVKDVPVLMGQAPGTSVPGTSFLGPGPLGGGNTLDKVERLLSQIDSILGRVQAIRSNPIVKAALPRPEMPLTLPIPSPTGPATSGPQPQTGPAIQPQAHTLPSPAAPALNVEGAKLAIAELFKKLEESGEGTKAMTLQEILNRYKSPLTKGIVEGMLLQELENNLPRLIK